MLPHRRGRAQRVLTIILERRILSHNKLAGIVAWGQPSGSESDEGRKGERSLGVFARGSGGGGFGVFS
jgi:hypothetical protein